MRANVSLSQRPDSRIAISELKMLTTDVLGYVEARQDEPRFEGWDEWIKENREQLAKKSWYELTVLDIVYKERK